MVFPHSAKQPAPRNYPRIAMKEPPSLEDNLYVLLTFDDRAQIITRKQCEEIVRLKNSGTAPTVSIGRDVIILSQIRGLPTLGTYRRQMKTKLAESGKRMCKRCGGILPLIDRCTCQSSDVPESKRPEPILEAAARENPALREEFLLAEYNPIALPEPKETPQTPEEKAWQKHYEEQRTQFIKGHRMEVGMDFARGKDKTIIQSNPVCRFGKCDGSGILVFQGYALRCDCTLSFAGKPDDGGRVENKEC